MQNTSPAVNARLEIPRLALHEQVVDRLRDMLVEGLVQAGAKLNERVLCERLGVSRTPLREAIKLLAAEGLVELVPNRGAVAVKLSEADLNATFEVLSPLEALAGELAAQRIDAHELAEIKALHYEMLAHHARQDLGGYYRLNALIHSAIIRAAGNPVLITTYETINARVQPLRYRSNHIAGEWKRAVEDHEHMMLALSTRNGAMLRDVLVEHLKHTQLSAVGALRELESRVGAREMPKGSERAIGKPDQSRSAFQRSGG